MDGETLDLIVRSRPTILEILENRGYTVKEFVDISPEDTLKRAIAGEELLRIVAPRAEESTAPCERAVVVYTTASIRLRVDKYIRTLFESEQVLPTDDIVVILNEPYHDVFNRAAVTAWSKDKTRLSFFPLKNVISNPARHVMVPPHRKLSAAETEVLMRSLHLKAKTELPHIKFHVDMQARVHGLVPGDIVEIQRPSETAGVYVTYRVCSA